jgi:hypothetical protein
LFLLSHQTIDHIIFFYVSQRSKTSCQRRQHGRSHQSSSESANPASLYYFHQHRHSGSGYAEREQRPFPSIQAFISSSFQVHIRRPTLVSSRAFLRVLALVVSDILLKVDHVVFPPIDPGLLRESKKFNQEILQNRGQLGTKENPIQLHKDQFLYREFELLCAILIRSVYYLKLTPRGASSRFFTDTRQ